MPDPTFKIDGATVLSKSGTTVSINSGVTFPSGHIIQTQYNSVDTETNVTVNNQIIYGTIDVEFNRKMSNSYFLITVSSVVYRPATTGQANLGYRISVNNSVIQSKIFMVKDDNSWTEVSRIYKDTTTGSVNDTVKIETAYQNNVANDNYFRLPTLLVYEVSP
tara:strand:+ start:386 stop:874 length:489 start_codon:yes stop_codon:yes gene_type:complete